MLGFTEMVRALGAERLLAMDLGPTAMALRNSLSCGDTQARSCGLC